MSDSSDSNIESKTGTISNLSVRDRMNLWKNRESETQAKSPINPSSSKKPEDIHHATSSSLAKFQNKSALAHENSPRLSFDSSHSSEKIGSSETKASGAETKLKSATISSGSILSPLRSTALASNPVKPAVPSPDISSTVAAKVSASNATTGSLNILANNSNKSNPPSGLTASPLSPTVSTTASSTAPATVTTKKSVMPANKIKVEVPSDSLDHVAAAVVSPGQLVPKAPSSPIKKTSAKVTAVAATAVIDDELNKLNAQMTNLQLVEKSSAANKIVVTSSPSSSSSSSSNSYISNDTTLEELTRSAIAKISEYESMANSNGSAPTTAIIQELNSLLKLLKQGLTSIPKPVLGNNADDLGITSWSVREAELNVNNKKEVDYLEMQLSEARRKIVVLEQQQLQREVASTATDCASKDNLSSINKQAAVDSQRDSSSSINNNNNNAPSQSSMQQQQLPRQPPIHVIIDEEDGKLRIMISKNKRRIMTQEYKV